MTLARTFGDRLSRTPWQPILVLAAIAIAYHYSLLTLARGVLLPTPLAYLGLIPVIAVLLAWIRLSRLPQVLPFRDEAMDHALGRAYGLGFVALAIGLSLALSTALTYGFWQYRLDLLTLPLFAAGAVSFVFGVRALRAVKFPLLFLLLAWPIPYVPLVGEGMVLSTTWTVGVVDLLTQFVPFASPAAAAEGTYLVHAEKPFLLSVASACAGVNGLVGFLIVGTAMTYVVRGPLFRRLTWLVAGLLLIWMLNVLRIIGIFAVGALFGRQTAVDVLHPVAGLLVFNVGVLLMMASVPVAGLRYIDFARRDDASSPASGPTRPSVNWPARRIVSSLVVVAVVAFGGSFVNGTFARFAPVTGDHGELLLTPFDIRTATVPDWTGRFLVRRDDFQVYFGDNSSFERYAYHSSSTAAFKSNVPVYAEVVSTDDGDALASFGVEACYRFHAFDVVSEAQVDVGAGVTASLLSYLGSPGSDRSALWWEWPYEKDGRTWYQRVVLFVADANEATIIPGTPAGFSSTSEQFRAPETLLVSVAREMVKSQVSANSVASQRSGS